MSIFNIVLVEPEIPPNTGNIARTCVLTGTRLHLVEPLGFSISDNQVKRSGLDYWSYLDLNVYKDYISLKERNGNNRFIYFSTTGKSCYHEINYKKGDYLVFGCETRGLPEDILEQADTIVRIPMINNIERSLNLGNSVALVLYEALRQHGFPGLS